MSTDPVSKDDGSSELSWMDESKWQFLQENSKLISVIALRWREHGGGRYVMWDDLYQGALLLFAVCLKTWTPDKGTFSTYYYKAATRPEKYLVRGIFGEYTEKNGRELIHSLNVVMGTDDDGSDDIASNVSDGACLEDEIIAKDESKRLAQAISRLPDDLQSHALNILNDDINWADVGSVVDLHNRTLEALRGEME